ncbi:MAG: DHHA1 domain-containing protein [Candidatus Helarchaeota archaeon]
MIITHADADGWCSAGIFLLTDISKSNGEKIETTRYSTVRYINILLSQILKRDKPCKLFIFDLNADDSETYKNLLIKLSNKGFQITLIDHHIMPNSFDQSIKEKGVKVIRNLSMCCSELVYKQFKDHIAIKDRDKAEFLMCLGAIADKRISKNVNNRLLKFRWEKSYDLYAINLAGIKNGYDFLDWILEEKENKMKKIYDRARRKRIFLEKIKKEVFENLELIGERVGILRIFKKYIGLAASIMIDIPDIDYAIAIGNKPSPTPIMRLLLFFKSILRPFLRKKVKKNDLMIRISIRGTKPIHNIIIKIAKLCNGFGGGHKYACGARIPPDKVNLFIKNFLKEIS